MRSELVDKKQSILLCCSQSYSFILNSARMAVIALTNNMRNFCCERHGHLHPVLYGVNSMYRMIVDSNRMGIVIVTVEDDTYKPKTVSSL